MNWLYYLLEANIYLSIFYLCYAAFLKRETHYVLNRIYLLTSCLASFFIPVVQIGALQPAVAVRMITRASPIIQGRALLLSPTVHSPGRFNIHGLLLVAYGLGVLIWAIGLIVKLTKLAMLAKNKGDNTAGQYKLIYLEGSATAFSFFNCLFIGREASGKPIIIRHELVHIRQRHSVDVLLLEIVKIISWFNPVIYLLQNSLKAVHEYIADEKTANGECDALSYASFLLNNAYGIGGSSITQSFFNYNLLKNRIIMLHQKRSGNLARLKYLLAIPICAGLLCASTLVFSKSYGWINIGAKHNAAEPAVLAKEIAVHKAHSEDSAKMIRYSTTKKGYKYREDGYLINNKANFRVIIVENGTEKEYFRNSATTAEIKMLREKYGYEFPTMNIFPKLPPPPPMPPAPKAEIIKRPPPPPPAPPVPKTNDPAPAITTPK